MTPTQQLKEEHEGIKLMLQIMDAVCDKLDAGEKVDPQHLESIIEFISVFADKCHHGKEEDCLFKAMIEAGFPENEGPIPAMLDEHNQGRNFVKGMREAVSAYKTQDPSVGKKFAKNAGNYINLLTEHIDKENNILYEMADMHLSEEKQSELLKEFGKVELERIGVGKHEEFHRLLENLSKIYLR